MKRLLIPLLLAIIVGSCKQSSLASIIVKPFLEDYYGTDIRILSEDIDSLYCPVPAYTHILEKYSALSDDDYQTEEALYKEFLDAGSGPKNSLGVTVRYKVADKDGETFEEIFFIDGGQIKCWGLNVSLDKALILSRHSEFQKRLNQ